MHPCPACQTPIEVEPGNNKCSECGHEWMAVMPQAGPQEMFLSLRNVDIVIYGGQAGGGKTWALLLDPVSDIETPGFGAVYFRRESTQITNEGGLWDESGKLYPHLGGKPRSSPSHQWVFSSGVKFSFTHLNEENDKYNHQGGQYPWIGFDELTHFTETQFWYLVGRNRGLTKAPKRVRAGTNPDAGSWVKQLIAPWVDESYPNPAKPGQILWLVKLDSGYWFFDNKDAAMAFAKEEHKLPDAVLENAVKSITFIPASVWDNKILMRDDPGYLANLLALPEVERRRLLYGDWGILTDRFFHEWSSKTADGSPWHVVPSGECPKDLKYIIGSDYGFAAPWSCHLIGFDTDGRGLVCRELYTPGRKASEQANDVCDLVEQSGITQAIVWHAPHDVFAAQRGAEGRQEPIVDIYRRVIRERELRISIVQAGRDPLTRANRWREYLADWGASELWPQGQPGIQIMDCCPNLIRTIPLLKSDVHRPEMVDTDLEDHAYDGVGHVLTSRPGRSKPPAKSKLPPKYSPAWCDWMEQMGED